MAENVQFTFVCIVMTIHVFLSFFGTIREKERKGGN